MSSEKTPREVLMRANACDPALAWIGDRTPEQIVAECPRGDWLIWALRRSGASLMTWRRIALGEADAVAHLDPTPEGAAAREAARAVLANDTPETREAEAAEAWAAARAAAEAWAAASETATAARAAAAAWEAAAAAWEAAAWEAAWEAHRQASADRIRSIITVEERAALVAWLGGGR